jgi:D-tyrosyl-tRNA(Tyr) deacylase
MRGLVQRVASASVTVRAPGGVDGEVVGAIGAGLCLLVGVTHGDTERHAEQLAAKVWNLRVFDDDAGRMDRSAATLADEGHAPGVLVVSQFTLYGDTSRGRRPSWVAAARPELAEPLVDAVVANLQVLGAQVATGRFRTDMEVSLVNDGPVTLLLEV